MMWHGVTSLLNGSISDLDGSIMRMWTVQNYPHATELLLGAEDWRCHRDSIRALGRRRVLWSITQCSGTHLGDLKAWGIGWSLLMDMLIPFEDEREDDDDDNERRRWFCWLSMRMIHICLTKGWDLLMVDIAYIPAITYHTWSYNVQEPTFPLSTNAKQPNTQQPINPKKHEETPTDL